MPKKESRPEFWLSAFVGSQNFGNLQIFESTKDNYYITSESYIARYKI